MSFPEVFPHDTSPGTGMRRAQAIDTTKTPSLKIGQKVGLPKKKSHGSLGPVRYRLLGATTPTIIARSSIRSWKNMSFDVVICSWKRKPKVDFLKHQNISHPRSTSGVFKCFRRLVVENGMKKKTLNHGCTRKSYMGELLQSVSTIKPG